MVEKLAEMPIVAPRSSQELQRSVELLSRKINEIVRTTRSYAEDTHASTHYTTDALDLDLIPGTLDAAKLYGDAALVNLSVFGGVLTASEIEVNYLTATQLLIANPINLSGLGSTMPFNISASAPKVSNLDADKLDTQDGAYYLNAGNLSGTLLDLRLTGNVPLKDTANVYTASAVYDRTVATANAYIMRVLGSDAFAQTVSGRSNFRFVAGGSITAAWGEIASGKMGMPVGTHIRAPALEIGATEVITSARVITGCTFGGTMRGAAIINADGTLPDLTTKFNTLLAQLRTRGDIAP